MPSEAILKFKNVIEKADFVALRTGETKDITKILAGFLLHNLFLKLGKKSNLEINNTNGPTKDLMVSLFGESTGSAIIENILIKIDTKKLPVSNLKYEKDGDTLKLILETTGKFLPEEILISKETQPVDILILIDPPEEEVEIIIKALPHKDVIKLTGKPLGFSLKIYEIARTLSENIVKEFADALWLLSDFEEKESTRFSKEWARMKSGLLESGAEAKKIRGAKELLWGRNLWKLLGRALARSEFEKSLETVWSFLPIADFQKTVENTEEIMLQLLQKIQALRDEGNFFALLWESPSNILSSSGTPAKSIHAVISGKDPSLVNTLAGLMGTSPASSYFFINDFKTFSEAELKIRSSIRQVL